MLISLILAILTLLVLFVCTYYIFQDSKVLSSKTETIATPAMSHDLLDFDREISKILNNPHLSETDKERLTNEYVEQYLLKNSMN